jgi:TolA-binding protein
MWLGRIYIRKYLYDKAIEQFSGINEKSGEYPAGQYNTALCLELQGDTVSAVSGYQTVAYRFPAHELADNAMLQAGILFLKLQRGKEAAASFTSVLQQYRDRETADDALFHLGKVFEKDPVLRDLERARSIYRLFLKKADAGVTQYRNSPLRERVGRDLRHLEQSYFRMKP